MRDGKAGKFVLNGSRDNFPRREVIRRFARKTQALCSSGPVDSPLFTLIFFVWLTGGN